MHFMKNVLQNGYIQNGQKEEVQIVRYVDMNHRMMILKLQDLNKKQMRYLKLIVIHHIIQINFFILFQNNQTVKIDNLN